MNELARLLGPVVRRIGNLVSRGSVKAVNATAKMQMLQVGFLAGETKDNVEHFEPYGYTSNPQTGAEAVGLFLDGDRSHGIVVVVADRRYRLLGLAAGEMAIHDDQGQKVHLTRNGIVIDGAGKDLTIQNTPTITLKAATKVRMETPLLEVTGEIKAGTTVTAAGNVYDQNGAKSMSGMRSIYNGHRHGGSATPDSSM